MICKYCGKGLADDESFCIYCGQKLQETSQPSISQEPQTTYQTQQQHTYSNTPREPISYSSNKKSNSTTKVIVGAGIAIVLVIVIAIVAIMMLTNNTSPTSSSANTSATTQIDTTSATQDTTFSDEQTTRTETTQPLETTMAPETTRAPENTATTQSPTYGTVTLSDGSTYTGDLTNGVPNGNGSIVYKDGSTYTGSFVNGKRSGYGEATFPSTSKNPGWYKGYWSNDKINGQGEYYYSKVDTYWSGEWVNGVSEGYGVWTMPYKVVYAEFHNDKINDQHAIVYYTEDRGIYHNGDQFVGAITNNIKNGEGWYYHCDTNTTVHGSWTNGELTTTYVEYYGNECPID